MRLIAGALLVALLLPAAMTVVLNGDACCCGTGAGATCPMKRSASTKPASEETTCGMARSETMMLPNVGLQRPATLVEPIASTVDRAAVHFGLPVFPLMTRARHTPVAPPPKLA